MTFSTVPTHSSASSQALLNAQADLLRRRQSSGAAYRPPTAVPSGEWVARLAADLQQQTQTLKPAVSPKATTAVSRTSILHYAEIGLAAMSAGESIHYQLWLLARLVDGSDAGRLDLEALAAAATGEASKTRLYNLPRFRQIISEGSGRYWQISNGRLWLTGLPRLAASLGIARLTGTAVEIEPGQIAASAGYFRAHIFAAWLTALKNPISQQTIERITGITPRTQRRYLRRANVATRDNLAIGPALTDTAAQDCAWQHDGVFVFTDFNGKQGPAGKRYLAWRLPTSYQPRPAAGAKRAKRRANRHIADLAPTQERGNGEAPHRLFYATGAAAARAYNHRSDDGDIYWRFHRSRSTGADLWHSL